MMVIESLGLVGGAATRLFVWVSDYYNKKQQHQQDMERLRAEADLERAKVDAKLTDVLASKQTQDAAQVVVSSDPIEPPSTGYCNLDTLNSLVRPALTFWYCLILYSVYKICILIYLFNAHLPIMEVATEFDRTLVASMISYWFTDRTFHKLTQ